MPKLVAVPSFPGLPLRCGYDNKLLKRGSKDGIGIVGFSSNEYQMRLISTELLSCSMARLSRASTF
ncbi:hypothetical protein LC609_34510 [Nostoc sp. XA013]|nr:hypothetical protein [Nostoc sp. XA013]